MSDAAAPPEPLAIDPPADPAVADARWRLALLRELTELGMDLARDLHRRALAEPDAVRADETPAPTPAAIRDPAAAFAQVSRAVRLTITLHARTEAALRDLEAGVARAREAAAEEARAAAAKTRRRRMHDVEFLVLQAAEAELGERGDIERFGLEMGRRLGDVEAECFDPDLPLRQAVEGVCRTFGLTPDWSRWDGEGWVDPDPPPWPWRVRDDPPVPPPDAPPPDETPVREAAHVLE